MSCGVGPLDCVADAMAVVGSDDGVVVDSVVRPVYCVHHPLDAPRAGGGCARFRWRRLPRFFGRGQGVAGVVLLVQIQNACYEI
jgi:hypothetical protein